MKRESAASVIARRALSNGRTILVALVLGIVPALSVRAQAVPRLAQELANNRLEATELTAEERAGTISAPDFDRRSQANRVEFDRIERELSALPLAAHEQIRQQAAALFKERQGQAQASARPPNAASVPMMVPTAPGASTTAASLPWYLQFWWILMIPVAGVGALVAWRRLPKSQDAAPSAGPRKQATPAQVQELRTRLAPAVAAMTQAAAQPPVAITVSPTPAGTGTGSGRDRMLAQVKAKYQAAITAAMDALTEIQLVLQQNAVVPETIRTELRRIGGSVYSTTHHLLCQRVLSTGRALVDAALLKPLVRAVARQLRGRGLFFKLIVAFALFMFFGSLFARQMLFGLITMLPLPLERLVALLILLIRSGLPGFIVLYLITVPIIFLFSRRAQTKGAMDALAKSAAGIKSPQLLYAYAKQVPSGAAGALRYQALLISSAADKPLVGETSLINQPDESGLGSFALLVENVAMYRKPASGSLTLHSVQPGNVLMSTYGSVVTEAVTQHSAELEPLIEALASYGDLKWRERQQATDIPRAEALFANVAQLEKIWRPVAVSDNAFDFLIRRIDLFNMREKATPNGILLTGYPGNGKEYLARKIAESVFAQFYKPQADQLASVQAIKELWATQSKRAPVVMFIDYADQVFARAGEQESAGRDATLAWLEEWSRHEPAKTGVWVVMSAQTEQNLHPRIVAQFGSSKIEIKPPDAAGRELILANAARENQLPGSAPRSLIETSGGSSIRDLQEIVREVRMQSMPEAPTERHWREAALAVLGNVGRDSSKTWDALVLPPETKALLQRAARILREADRYKDKKINVPNILLFGPPGTGKTDVARTFANEGGVKFISATTADLKGQYQGQSAHLVRELFGRARASAPSVLFIDEIETVAAKRGSPTSDSYTQDIVTEMLAEMDGASKSDRAVIVLAATNLVDQIDDAILNRFTSRIEIPLPDEAARTELLRRLIADRPIDAALDVDEIAAFLAKRLKGKSGRDLVKLVDRAMERAVSASDTPDDVRLTRALLVTEGTPQGKEVSEADLQKIWAQIVLQPEVKADVLDKIRMFNRADKAAPRGLLLFGPPGTGKTEIARRIADSASCAFLSLKGPDLKAGYTGQSGERVKKRWEEARSRGRCVMFIDECEGVFARRGGTNTDSFSEEVVQAFLAEWDGVGSEDQRVWVVGATNRRDILDEAIVSRFGATVEIGLPGPAERVQILGLEMQKLERSIAIPAFVGTATTGMSGRNLARLAREVCTQAAKQGGVADETLWQTVLKRLKPDPGGDASWDTLILAPETINQLKTVCTSLQNLESLRSQGVALPKGALLFGPPGTGKTQIARTLARESGLSFISATTADLKAGYTGQSGQKTRELFERARGSAPCILFIDEIDAVCPARGGSNSDQFTVEIVNQILQETEGVKVTAQHVYVLGATNRPEAVDEAVRSRLKDAIEIPLPDESQRRQLLKVFLSKLKKVDFNIDEVSAEVARRTKNLGGRALLGVVEQASQRSVQRAFKNGTPDNIVLTRDDLLQELQPQGKEVSEADLQKIWAQIVLQPEVKADVLDKIRMFNRADKAAPRGLLLFGPPGTGKTEIARRIADSASCAFLSLKGPDLKAGYTGQSGERVKKRWEEARSRGRCVMFIDECEGVFARRGGTNTDSFSEEVVQAFLAEWDGVGSEDQRVWVVGATNRRDILDEAIVSRFGATVEIGLPGPAERVQILGLEMQKLERSIAIPAFVGTATTGMSGRNLAMLAREVCTLAEKQGGVPTDATWQEAINHYVKAGGTAVDKGAGWDSLVLPEAVMEKLRDLCETLRHVEEFQEQGFDVPKGALLYGPPGTGKTQIARTFANESGLPFIAVTTADLKAGFIGQSGQKTREIFERARGQAPCILFIDEIDAVCPKRGGQSTDSFTDEIVMQLLQEMDGVRASVRHVFVLAATNLIDAIDPAVRSRFEEKIEIGYPSQPERQRLFRQMLSKQRVDFDRDAVAEELSQLTDNLAGRDIRALIQRASQMAVRRAAGNPKALMLTRADLLSAAPAALPPARAALSAYTSSLMPGGISSGPAQESLDQPPQA